MFRSVFSNTSWMILAEIFNRAFTFALTIAIVRTFSQGDYGDLRFAFSFVALFTLITDFGLTSVIVREVSRNKSEVEKFVGNTFTARIALNTIAISALFILANFTVEEPSQKLLLYLAGVDIFLSSLAGSLMGTFVAFQMMRYNAMAKLLDGAVLVGSGYLVIFSGLPIYWIVVAHILASLARLVYAIIMTSRKITKINFTKFDWKFTKWLFSESWPFAVTSGFTQIYTSFDMVMMGYMGLKHEVALYGAAYTILNLFVTLRLFFSKALFPNLSKYVFSSQEHLRRLVFHFKKFFIFLAFPMGVGITLLAPEVMRIAFGEEYVAGAIALQILIWGIVFMYLNLAQPAMLSAANKQKTTMTIFIIGGLLNVVLNLILIPKFKIVGAAIATDVSYLFNLVVASYYADKIVKTNFWVLTPKPVLGAVIMGAVMFFLRDINMFLLAVTGFFVYILIMMQLKYFTAEEIEFGKRYLARVATKIGRKK